MPRLPLPSCNVPHCRKEVRAKGRRFCVEHDRTNFTARAKYEADSFYNSMRWRRFRASYLKLAPLCRTCEQEGLFCKAVILDHITPRSQGGADYDLANLQPLCQPCHDKKRRTEVGLGVGRHTEQVIDRPKKC